MFIDNAFDNIVSDIDILAALAFSIFGVFVCDPTCACAVSPQVPTY